MSKYFLKSEIAINQMIHGIIKEVDKAESESKIKGYRLPNDFKKYQDLCKTLKEM